MNKEQLDEIKARLLEERQRVTERLDGFNDDALNVEMRDSISELSSYDNHPADIGSEMFERSKDSALREAAKINLAMIEDALHKIEQGSYGKCDICGHTIDEERLEAMPSTTICLRCKSAYQDMPQRNFRPVEEDVLVTPFSRTFLDHTDNTAFDGEDAWQAVERYGTASDIPNEDGELGVYGDQDDPGIVNDVDGIPYERGLDGTIYKDFDGEDDESPTRY